MRPSILICLFVVFGYIAKAQFTILPQLGFENDRTSIHFNGHSCISPFSAKLLPEASVRFDYKNKKGNGPFLDIASSRSIVEFNFSDPQTGMNSYTVSKGNTQLRLEGGYQVSTQRIYFTKSGSANAASKIQSQKNMARKSCGGYTAGHSCGNKLTRPSAAKSAARASCVSIQPSLGVAYIPFTPSSEIYTKSGATQTSYAYNAGNWKTAITGGVGFEFGKNEQRKFVFSINYLKSIGSLDAESITSIPGNKSVTTSLRSDAASWSFRIGIPISFSAKKPATLKPQFIQRPYHYHTEQNSSEHRCGQYRMHCGKVI